MPIQFAPIYTRLAELGEPYALPADWSWVGVDPDCRQLPEAVAAFRALEKEFPAEDLLTSGVARQADGKLALSPDLMADEPGFIVLHNDAGDAFDVATAGGCLYGGAPALRMHLDRATKQALQASDCPWMYDLMFGCFSMADTVLLRSLGLAAAPAAMLDSLTLAGLQRLLWLVGGRATKDIEKVQVGLRVDEPGDPATAANVDPHNKPRLFSLRLLAGSLARCTAEVPEALLPVACGLAAAKVYLGFEWGTIGVWHPTEEDLATIQYRRWLRSAEAVRRFLLPCPTRYPLEAFLAPGPPKLQKPAKPSPAEAYLQHLDRLAPPSRRNPTDPEPERGRYDELVDQLFVRPLVERAMQAKDLEDRGLFIHLATLARLYHHIVPAVLASERRSCEELRWNNGMPLPPEPFEQWKGLANEMLKVIRHRAAIRKNTWGGR